MAFIELPPWHQKRIGNAAYDTNWIDVKLKDGRIYRNLVLREGRVITGQASDPDGEGDLDFTAIEIKAVKRHGAIWPWW